MDINEFKSRIKSGALSGTFAFAGEEDYLKRYYLGELRSAIVTDEAFAPFNHIVFDGEDVKLAAILDAVKAVGVPTVEVHISDVDSREAFRTVSYIRLACETVISGRGISGYTDAIDYLLQMKEK